MYQCLCINKSHPFIRLRLRLTSTHLKAREIQSSLMRIGEFMKRISAIAEQLDFNRALELIILAAFRKWLGGNRAKGLLPEPPGG